MPLPLFVSETLHHEAIDWATRASANGGTISTTTIRAVSEFCRAIDTAGIRDRFARLNPFCGGNLSGALVPLYRSTSFGGTVIGNSTDTNVNFVSGDYADSGATGGIKGNGTNKYLNTGVAANRLAASSTHLGLGIVTANTLTSFRTGVGAYNGANNALEIGMRSGTSSIRACYWTRFATASDTFGTNIGSTGASLAAGNIIASWPTMYRDGVATGTDATTSQNYPSAHALFVFASNNSGTSVINHTDARFGWYSIGETMTAAQADAFSSALVSLRTSLGR